MSSSASGPKRAILYGYNASPFYQKTLHLLAHYGVSYDVVQTAAIPPRPMLSEALNITYRRIPLLVLDGEVHIDTAHIARALDATFGDKPGHGHSLLARSPVVQQHASLHWLDHETFGVAASLIPWNMVSDEFRADRAEFRGLKKGSPSRGPVPEEQRAKLRITLAELEAQMVAQGMSTDEQAGGRPLSPTSLVGGSKSDVQFLDISVYFVLDWLQTGLKVVPDLLPLKQQQAGDEPAPFPHVLSYLARMRAYLAARRTALPKAAKLDPTAAAQHIAQRGAPAAEHLRHHAWLGAPRQDIFDAADPLVRAGGLYAGQEVDVVPTDTGRVPQRGLLVGLTPQRITLVVRAGAVANHLPIALHFPRAYFAIMPVQPQPQSQQGKGQAPKEPRL